MHNVNIVTRSRNQVCSKNIKKLNFLKLSHKGQDFFKMFIQDKMCVFVFSTHFTKIFAIMRTITSYIIINI